MGQQFLSSPPASGGATPPPPTAGSRSGWPPPPPPNSQPPGGPGDPQLSDTMERMLRPQGLFQRPQPKSYDWNSQWTPGSATASTGPTPVTGAPPTGPGGPGGPAGPPPGGPGGPATGANPGLMPPGAQGQYQGPGGQYPPGAGYGTGAFAASGGPTPPPPPGYPAGGPATTVDRYGPAQGQFGPGGQFTAGQAQLPPGQLPPGQLPPGQYGQPGFPPGQYGTAQFGPGQAGPVQYGVDQYGATQVVQPYQGGPSGPYGMPGPYGPGQLGPDGQPVGPQRKPLTIGKYTVPLSPMMLAITGAAVVVVIAIIAFVSLSGSPSGSSGTPAAASSSTASAKASASAGGQSATEKAAATQLADLLKQSGSDHSAVTDAVLNVEACGKNLGADAQTFSTSATNRETLLARLAQLPGKSSLPAAMINDLSSAWQASASVDTDLAKWANHAATAGCHGGDLNYSSYKASINDDSPATNGKMAFVRLWNPLARQDGLPTYQAAQL